MGFFVYSRMTKSKKKTVPIKFDEQELIEIMASLTQVQADPLASADRKKRIDALLPKIDEAMVKART